MSINLEKSGMNIWSLSILYIMMVTFMVLMGTKAYNSANNEHLRLGEFIAYDSGDAHGYVAPIEEYIKTGCYEVGNREEKLVGRGPYYGVYYFIFRQFLPIAKTYDAMALLHILWYAAAIIVMMLLVEPYIKYKMLVWIIPVTTCILHVGFTYLPRIFTDPIAVSQLICFAYFYVLFNREKKEWLLLVAALFLAMASVMKPYLLPIYAICFFDWTISNKILNIRAWSKYVLIMAIPLVIICLPFTIRNAIKLHVFAPVQNSSYAGCKQDPVNAAMREMVRVWGENHVEWGDGLGVYFMPIEGRSYDRELPSHIYTSAYDADDLHILAEQCKSYGKMQSGAERDSIGCVLVKTMHRYRDSYVDEHPLWRIRASIRQLGFMVFPTSFSINTRHEGFRHIISNGVDLTIWLIAWIVLIVGAAGLILIVLRYKNMRILSWMAFYHMIFFAIGLGGEPRYYWIGQLITIIGLLVVVESCIIFFKEK